VDGQRLEGPGLRDLCQAVQPDIQAELTEAIDSNVAKAAAIPAPFDQAIQGSDDAPGRKAVFALIVSLENTGVSLRKLARALNIEIPETPPEDVAG
jgi:putative iron-regulated protein